MVTLQRNKNWEQWVIPKNGPKRVERGSNIGIIYIWLARVHCTGDPVQLDPHGVREWAGRYGRQVPDVLARRHLTQVRTSTEFSDPDSLVYCNICGSGPIFTGSGIGFVKPSDSTLICLFNFKQTKFVCHFLTWFKHLLTLWIIDSSSPLYELAWHLGIYTLISTV